MPVFQNCLNGNQGKIPLNYPKSWVCFHRNSLALVGGPVTVVHQAAQDFAYYATMGPAPHNGDAFSDPFYLEAGTYTLNVLGVTAATSAKIDWYLDGVLAVAGQDWYNGGGAPVYNVVRTANVTVVGNGQHILKGVVNGRTAGATSWDIILTAMAFY